MAGRPIKRARRAAVAAGLDPSLIKGKPPEEILKASDLIDADVRALFGRKKTEIEAEPWVNKDRAIEKILTMVSCGFSVQEACDYEGTPSFNLFYYWLKGNKEMQDRFTLAQRERTFHIADELLEIADGKRIPAGEEDSKVRVARDKLRVEAREWLLGKLNNTFADKKVHEGNPDKPFVVVVTSVLDREKPKQIEPATVTSEPEFIDVTTEGLPN